ncbi:MAG: Eco57I restriction-modification methylase domain-containing protein [Erysipelotrichaceae bacterium]|nr:Eco57I restriction-modification methylase domain-containing protein [Erysipelotrichaceae bacterium]
MMYHVSMKISDKVSLITPARFLFDAGKTPSVWNKKMLNDKHFKVIKYFENSKDIFDNVDIKGGVAITYRDKTQDFDIIGTFTPNETIRSIIKKVKLFNERTFADIIYSNTSYKYTKLFFEENEGFSNRVSGGSSRYLSSSCFDKFPEVFFEEEPSNENTYIRIVGRKNNQRVILYVDKRYINPPRNFYSYKLMLPSSNGSGKLGEVISGPFVAEPLLGATETFVSFSDFKNQDEANNALKYIKTKFARIMLGTKKVTQGNKNSKVWINVPVQDFSNNSKINWNKSIDEIDAQLFKKYKFSDEEIRFINETATEMN